MKRAAIGVGALIVVLMAWEAVSIARCAITNRC